MKKLLLFILLFVGCDSPEEIIVQEIMENSSGTYIGYSIEDCVTIELECVDVEGEYQFGEPESDILCVCQW